MKLLINDKEIANFLFSLLDHKESCKDVAMHGKEVSSVIEEIIKKKSKKQPDKAAKLKFKDSIEKAVRKDLKTYVDKIETHLKNRETFYFNLFHRRIDYFLNKLGKENVLRAYKRSKVQNFVKSTGLHIDPSATLMRRKDFNSVNQLCVLRNTVGNEQLLVSKIDNAYPFWFIDSGYTNFLEPNKKWHRLVKNHLHVCNTFSAPVDRLGIFKTFPQSWRNDGDRILVIEPGPFAAAIFHVDIKSWRYNVEKELRQYTDKKIVFREKAPKKTRPNLYKHLCDEDYHCVVHINSNAGTEAVWAGVPVITLDKHITSSISRNSLSEINNLYRPNIATWLCMLSYSQFTFEELTNGTAVNLVRKYHE